MGALRSLDDLKVREGKAGAEVKQFFLGAWYHGGSGHTVSRRL